MPRSPTAPESSEEREVLRRRRWRHGVERRGVVVVVVVEGWSMVVRGGVCGGRIDNGSFNRALRCVGKEEGDS